LSQLDLKEHTASSMTAERLAPTIQIASEFILDALEETGSRELVTTATVHRRVWAILVDHTAVA
jgi:hypothetical protein